MKTASLIKRRRPRARFVRRTAKPALVPTLLELLAPFDGLLEEAPPDLALNHDHYRLGIPKRHGR